MKNTAAQKLKQVPEGYLIIGVDPHKKKHAAVAITQDFTIRNRFKFDNNREGLGFSVTEGVSGGLGAGISTGGRVQPANKSAAIRITNSNFLLIIRQKTLYVNW